MPKKTNTGAEQPAQFALDETFRHLRTNIEFSQGEGWDPIQVLNVISTNPSEGKSTVSLNLAKVLADKYKKVLLVDCDLKASILHKRLKVPRGKGLSDLIASYQSGTSVMAYEPIRRINVGSQNPMYFLSAGTRVPNTSELLGSARFESILDQAKEEFDYILLDSPPTFAVSDGAVISGVSDGTLFVVSARDTNKVDAKTAINDLKRNGANVIGVVLTKVEDFKSSDYYYYGYCTEKKD